MLETLIYLAAAVIATTILSRILPPGTSLLSLTLAVGLLTALLAAARHGPTAIIGVIDAIGRLMRR